MPDVLDAHVGTLMKQGSDDRSTEDKREASCSDLRPVQEGVQFGVTLS